MNDQSVTVMPMMVNSIRQGIVASLLGKDEAAVPATDGEITASTKHARPGGDAMSGGWRRNGRKVHNRKRGELSVRGRSGRPLEGPKGRPAAVRASIRAKRPGNAGGAKGGRKVDA